MEQEKLNLILQESTLLQIAMAKKILKMEEMLQSLIKQEEPKVKKEPLYTKYFR